MKTYRWPMRFLALAWSTAVAIGLATAAPPAASSSSSSPTAAVHSALWGEHGERWDARGRLPDFSYAGFGRGEQQPALPMDTVSVQEFGAVGNGAADDTAAFQRALREAAGKTVLVPAGTYLLNDMLEIAASNTVLMGEDVQRSRLRFAKSLTEIRPNWGATTTGSRTSNYSWSGGLIAVAGRLHSQRLADVVAPAHRGDRQLALSTLDGLAVGDDVRLELRDDDQQSLATYLYQGDPGPLDKLKGIRVSLAVRITKLDAGKRRMEFDRPLSTDVQRRWSPVLFAAGSSVERVGIQQLTLEFPNRPYEGHFTELGFNAIALGGVRNCWIRDVHVHNCDSGFFVSGVNCTIQGVRFTSARAPESTQQATGHHGITLSGQDNLLSDFDYQTKFLHDITMTRGSAGNVVTRGRAVDLCFDHHRYAPHANLFTDIDLGQGGRMFRSGGGAALGRHSAAWTTFWGIRARKPQAWPIGWGPDLMNLIGFPAQEPALLDPVGRWFEPLDVNGLSPRNLYQAQLDRRLPRESRSARP